MSSPIKSSVMDTPATTAATTGRTPVDQRRVDKIRSTSWRSSSSAPSRPSMAVKPQASFEETSDVALIRYILALTPTPVCMKNDYTEGPIGKQSALVNVVNDPLYYTREHRVLREYRGWCASFIHKLTLSAKDFNYDVQAEYTFFRKYLSVNAFLAQRYAALPCQIENHGHSTSDSWGSGDSANSSGHDTLEQSGALVSTRVMNHEGAAGAIKDPSSTAMVTYRRNEFKPSWKRMGLRRSVTPEREREALEAGINLNDNYQGNKLSPFAIKCNSTPLEESCAVRIEEIHKDTTYQEFFDDIREGKVFQFSWQEPLPPYRLGLAARLVFSTRLAAENYIRRGSYSRRYPSAGGIWFHNQRVFVKWNHSHCPAMEPYESAQTRVLQIMANKDEHNLEQTIERVKEFVEFDLVSSREWLVLGNNKIIELEFPSIYGKSREVRQCLLRGNFEDGLNYDFKVRYGPDPCEERSRWR